MRHGCRSKDQVGNHEIKVRVAVGDKNTIERFPVEVLDKDLVAAAGGDPTKVGSLSSIDLTQTPHQLTWSLDGKNMLLLQGRQLDVLSADGQHVERTVLFERYCEALCERADYYVGMSPLEVHNRSTRRRARPTKRRSL